MIYFVFVADGIATCLADVLAIMARWYSHVYVYRLEKADVIALLADVMATGSYFSLSSMLLIRTSSHTCGRWYLPIFLFRDGLLTLMNIDSFINLEKLYMSRRFWFPKTLVLLSAKWFLKMMLSQKKFVFLAILIF